MSRDTESVAKMERLAVQCSELELSLRHQGRTSPELSGLLKNAANCLTWAVHHYEKAREAREKEARENG